METLHTIWVWFTTLGGLGAVVLAIFAANYLRCKIEGVRNNWESAIMPSIAFLLIHLGLYWIRPIFWVNWFNSDGFILMQLLLVSGLYTASLKTKAASTIGRGLVLVAVVGLGLGVWITFRDTHSDLFKPSTTLSYAYTPDYVITDENREVALKTMTFWRNNLPEKEAELMIWICYLESSFRQFEADGKTPLRGRKNPKDVGVCQINEDYWLKKPVEIAGETEPYDSQGNLEPEYDLNTLDGNLQMALWIEKNHGAKRWNTYEQAAKYRSLKSFGGEDRVAAESLATLAPVDEPGKVIRPRPGNWFVDAKGPVWVYTDNDERTASGPGPEYRDVRFPPTYTLRFQSRTKVPVYVAVIQ